VLVSVFIPAHNEAGNITPLLDKIACTFADHNLDGEVVLVDDGSTDGTAAEAAAGATRYPWLRVFTHRRRLGLTAAMKTGFRQVRGDVVVFLPADLESDPEEDVPKLLDKLAEGYDVVAGWRQGRREGKVVASTIYNFVSRRLFNVQAHDMNWIKAFRREVIDDLPLRSDWHRFILMIAADKGYKIAEVPTSYYPRQTGRSKYGFWRLPVSFLDVLVVKFLLTFSQKPMLFFGAIGSLFALTGLGIGLWLVYIWLATHTQQRPILLLAFVLILAGLLLFLVGFLAELVVSQGERIEAIEQRLRERGE
jgi:glycosyltransferase involved in cell wall biosynthesis